MTRWKHRKPSIQASDRSLATNMKVWSTGHLSDIALHNHTLSSGEEKQQQQQQQLKRGKATAAFWQKAQSFSLKGKSAKRGDWYIFKNSYCYRCFRLAEEKQRCWWRRWFVLTLSNIKVRKTNRTFAKNILVFVPLERCQSLSWWLH